MISLCQPRGTSIGPRQMFINRPARLALALKVWACAGLGWSCGGALWAEDSAKNPVDAAIRVAEIEHQGPVSFRQDIRPLLAQNCMACHSALKSEGGLNLEVPETMIAGGDAGPAVTPKDGKGSLLVKVAAHADEPHMPPDDNKVGARPLTPEALGLIVRWIDEGALNDMAPGAAPRRWQSLSAALNPIFAVALSPDNQFIACGRANQVFLYELATGKVVTRLTDPALLSSGLYQQPGVAHLDLVQSLAFSPDGDFLASGSFQEVKLWRRPRNVRRLELALPPEVLCVAVSPDARWIAAGYAQGEIHLADLANGQEWAVFKGHAGAVTGLRATADAQKLVSVSADQTLRVWSVADRQQLGQIKLPIALAAVDLIRDNGQAAVGCADNLVRVVQLPQGPVAPWAATPGLQSLLAADDGRSVSTIASEGAIRMLDAVSGSLARELPRPGMTTQAVAWAPTANRMATAEADGMVSVWNTADLRLLTRFGSGTAPTALAFHPGGNGIVSGTVQGQLHQWKLDVPSPSPIGPRHEAPLQIASLSASGRIAQAIAADGKASLVVAEMQSGQVVQQTPNLLGEARAIAISHDGQTVALALAGQPIRVQRVSDGAPVGSVNASNGLGANQPQTLALLPDSQSLIVATDRTLQRVQISDNAKLGSYELPSAITSVAVSHDASRIAAGLEDGTLAILNSGDGSQLARVSLGKAAVRALAFSHDGQRLAGLTGTRAAVVDSATQGVVEVLEVGEAGAMISFASPAEIVVAADARQLAKHALRWERSLPAASGKIVKAVFRADGQVVFSASVDGQVRGLNWANPGQVLFELRHGAPLTDLALSGDGRWLATGGEDRQIRLWSAENGGAAPHPAFGGFQEPLIGIALSRDHQRLAGLTAREVLMFNQASGALEETFRWGDASRGVGLAAVAEPAGAFILATEDGSLRRLTPSVLYQLAGHSQPVSALAVHPLDPNQLVSGSQDGSIRAWNLPGRQQSRQWDHGGPVRSLAFRPDGKQLASAGGHALVKLWNFENGQVWAGPNNQPLAEMKGDLGSQLHVAHGERKVAATSAALADRKKALQEAEELTKSSAEAVKVAMTNQENTAKTLAEKTEANQAPQAAKVAADAMVVAAMQNHEQLTAKVAAAKAAAEKEPQNAELAKALAEVQQAAAEADKQLAPAQAKAKEAAQAANKAEQERVAADAAHMAAEQALAVAMAARERAVAAVPVAAEVVQQAEAQAAQAQADLGAAKQAAAALDQPIQAVAYSPDGSQLASAGQNRLVRLWNSEQGTPGATYAGHPRALSAIAFVDVGRLVSAGGDATIVWDMAPEWRLEHVLGAAQGDSALADRVLALAFSPDGKLLATGAGEPSRGGEIKLWNMPDGSLARTLVDPHSDAVFSLSFSPDGQFLASSSADRFMKVFQVNDGALRRVFEGHTHHVLGVGWRFDAKLLATCGADGVAKVWDFATGDQKLTTAALGKELTSIGFIADSPRVLVTSGDKTARVYHTDNGSNERTLGGAADFLQQAALSFDGKIAVAGTQDSKILVWNVETGQLLRQLDPPPVEPAK